MPGPSDHDEELDDIMSQIMQGEAPRIVPRPLPKEQPKPAQVPKRRRPSHFDHPITQSAPQPVAKPAKKRRKRRGGAGKVFLVLLGLIIAGGGGYALYRWPLQSVLYPSPFSHEVKTATTFPIYYPASLPPGFSIKKDTIFPPTNGVLVYAITNGDSHIAVTMQAKPAGLTLDPLLAKYTDVSKVETPIGRADVGLDDNNTMIAHILTNKTWMILNTDTSVISRGDFEALLKTLKQG